MKNLLLTGLGLAALGAAALASAESAPPTEFGAETKAWLELQESGNAAFGAARPMSGEVADKVWARYVESFTRPIPEEFERQNFATGNSSGSSGGN